MARKDRRRNPKFEQEREDYIAQIIEDYDVEDAKVINFYPEDNVRSGITKRFVQIFDRIRGDKK